MGEKSGHSRSPSFYYFLLRKGESAKKGERSKGIDLKISVDKRGKRKTKLL